MRPNVTTARAAGIALRSNRLQLTHASAQLCMLLIRMSYAIICCVKSNKLRLLHAWRLSAAHQASRVSMTSAAATSATGLRNSRRCEAMAACAAWRVLPHERSAVAGPSQLAGITLGRQRVWDGDKSGAGGTAAATLDPVLYQEPFAGVLYGGTTLIPVDCRLACPPNAHNRQIRCGLNAPV